MNNNSLGIWAVLKVLLPWFLKNPGNFCGEIREREGLLETQGSPCALFAHKEELRELAFRLGAKERT